MKLNKECIMFKFIKLWFRGIRNRSSKPSVPVVVKNPEGKPVIIDTDYYKIGIVVGHTNKDKGATAYNKVQEYTFNTLIANDIKPMNKEVKVFFRDIGGLKGAMTEAAKWGADLVLELHLNSFTKEAFGAEILVAEKDEVSKNIATVMLREFCSTFNIKSRGVKIPKGTWTGKKDRGWLNGAYAKFAGVKAYLLIEPCFANIKTEESEKIIENPKAYSEFLTKFMERL